MKLSDYKNSMIMTDVCPSGAPVVFRMLSLRDYFEELGSVPDLNTDRKTTLTTEAKINDTKAVYKLYLTRAVKSFCGGKIVDKPQDECGENEISFDSIQTGDASYMAQKIANWLNPTVKMDETGMAPVGARFPAE